jgi:hypothetical protein
MGFQEVAKAISKVGALDFSGIGKAVSLNTANMNQVAKNVARNRSSALNSERRALIKSMDGMAQGTKEYVEAAEEVAKLNKQVAGLHSAYRTGTVDSVNKALKDVTGKDKMGYLNFAQGYFGDKKYGATRIKTAIGVYAGANIGGRMLSGGSITTNSQGERDIAGIPFI